MMSNVHAWLGVVLLAFGVSCSRGNLQSTESCSPGLSECVSDRLARICPEDGAGYLAFSCQGDEICEAGACVGSCRAGASTCITKDVLRVCTADGRAATAAACPVGSECQDGRCRPLQPKRVCAPGAWACATETVGKECELDGMGWVLAPCSLGERCSKDPAGPRCILDPTAAVCERGSNVCLDGTALHCLQDGTGYSVQACPDSAPCTEGMCRGEVCIAGESRCQPFSVSSSARDGVLTCVDGSSWELDLCERGEECLFDGVAATDVPALRAWWNGGQVGKPPVPLPSPMTASCRRSRCSPYENYSSLSCGSPIDPGLDANRYYSRCEENAPFAPNAWAAYRCPEPTQCDPNRVGLGEACNGTCLPGDLRCSADGSGLQTCSDDGEWGDAVTNCNSGQICVSVNTRGAACIDPECAYFSSSQTQGGRCESESSFRPCGRDGLLQDVDATCLHCELDPNAVTIPTTPKPYFPGTCVGPLGSDPCKAGERACASSDQYWECEAATWRSAELHRCAPGTFCFGGLNAGEHHAACTECEPRSARCSDDGKLEYCSADGKWLPPMECEVGSCQWGKRADGKDGYGCRTACLPGSVTCVSATEYQKCQADGRLSASSSTCVPGTECRRNSSGSGADIGCVECAGPTHATSSLAFGLPDSRCEGNALVECLASDTWGPRRECTNDTRCEQFSAGDGATHASCVLVGP